MARQRLAGKQCWPGGRAPGIPRWPAPVCAHLLRQPGSSLARPGHACGAPPRSASPGARAPGTPAGPLRYALICCGSRVTRWLGEDTPAARLPAVLARGPEPPETPAGPLRYALICCGSRVTRWLGEDTPAARLPSPARPGWPAGARLQGARLDSSHVQRYPGPELAVLVPAQVAGLACTDGPGCPRHAGPGRLAVPPRRVRELPELGVYV